MPRVFGSYQDIPILDGEFSLRAGVEAGRGWVRVLLKDLGGSVPDSANLKQLKEFWDRNQLGHVPLRKNFQQEAGDPESTLGAQTITKAPPPGQKGLKGPFGDLIMVMESEQNIPETRLHLKNIFWVEAVIETVNSVDPGIEEIQPGLVRFGKQGVVRIELADSRLLWPMGGYVFGWKNRLINEVDKTLAGRIFQWDPTVENPTRLNDISADVSKAIEGRPVLDAKTLTERETPWTALILALEAAQQLPGPPVLEIVSRTAGKAVPFNLNYGGAALSKKALEDIMERYNLILAPTYGGKYIIYDRGQNAKGVVGNRDRAGGNVIELPSDVKEVFRNPDNLEDGGAELTLAPLSIEVVGERVIEEIACPTWVMVLRDDGTVFRKSGSLGRAMQWVEARELLDAWGIDFDEASRSLISSYDKGESKAFDFIGDPNDPVSQKRKKILRANFFKSFMVSPGEFRRFLPIMPDRAEGGSHALNFENMNIQRSAFFQTDGWTPSTIREVGAGAYFINNVLAPVPPEDVRVVDAGKGVITFRNPIGNVVHDPDFNFLDRGEADDVLSGLLDELSQYFDAASALEREIRRANDERIFNILRNGVYVDDHAVARNAMEDFIVNNAAMISGRAAARPEDPAQAPGRGVARPNEVFLNKKTLGIIEERLGRGFNQEAISSKDPEFTASGEFMNLSEAILVEPRILGIWAWERDYGLMSDWYRFRGGDIPEVPAAFPIRARGLRQYISLNGATNKKAVDTLAQIQVNEFLDRERKAKSTSVLKFAGFQQVLLSGTVPEVTFKMSTQHPPIAETVVTEKRFIHGTEGRPPAVATWTAFLKKVAVEGGGGEGGGRQFGGLE